jgi:hypothetical protein
LTKEEIIFLVEEDIEGGYTSRALGYSIFTEAANLADLKTNIRDAVICHFGNSKKPSIIRLQSNKHL